MACDRAAKLITFFKRFHNLNPLVLLYFVVIFLGNYMALKKEITEWVDIIIYTYHKIYVSHLYRWIFFQMLAMK